MAPEVPVADLEESLAYYENKLGFQVVMKMPEGDYAIMERDDVALHLFQDGSGTVRRSRSTYSRVGSMSFFASSKDEGRRCCKRSCASLGATAISAILHSVEPRGDAAEADRS